MGDYIKLMSYRRGRVSFFPSFLPPILMKKTAVLRKVTIITRCGMDLAISLVLCSACLVDLLLAVQRSTIIFPNLRMTVAPPRRIPSSQRAKIHHPIASPGASIRTLLDKPLAHDLLLPIRVPVHPFFHNARLIGVVLRPSKGTQYNQISRELLKRGPSNIPLAEFLVGDVDILMVGRSGALGRFAGPFLASSGGIGGSGRAEGVGGAVDEGTDARVFAGVDDGPADRGAAVEVVERVSAELGGSEGAGDAGVGGQVNVCLGVDGGQKVALQGWKVGVDEAEFGTELVGRC